MPPRKKQQQSSDNETGPGKEMAAATSVLVSEGSDQKKKAATKQTVKPKKQTVVSNLPEGEKDKAEDKAAIRKSSQNKGKKKNGTKGTSQRAKRARQTAFLKALVRQNVRFNITTACAEAGICRRSFEKWRAEDPKFAEQYEEITEAQLDKWEEALHKNILAGDATSVIFALKTKGRKRGYIEKDHPTNIKVNAILDEWSAGTLTSLEAGIKIHKLGCSLPKVLELQLSKNEPLKPPGDDEYQAPSIEEIERRAMEAEKAVQEQRTHFLPQRIEEVAQLKQELKDLESFGPGAESGKLDE